MKKKNKQKRIPAYAFGTSGSIDIAGLADGIGQGVAGMFDQFGNRSTAQTTGQAVKQSISDISNRTLEGMKVGSQFGPWGALIGGAAGTTIGLIGRKGGVTQTAGFTDNDETSLGTGLIGAFNNSRIRKEIEASKRNVANNRVAVASTGELRSDWDDIYDSDVDVFALGGQTASLAYVDDGELIQTPDGSINKVPEHGNPTDSNLVNLPDGSRILSDKLKVPGTKKTFAQIGEEMMTKRKSKGKDRFAQNSEKLNEMNNNMIHDQLFVMQEQVKNSKGIKGKTKAFSKGGQTPFPAPWSRKEPDMPEIYKMNATASEIPKTLSAPSGVAPYGSRKPASSFDWKGFSSNASTALASLAPVISNLTSSKEPDVAAVYNPYSDLITRTMRRRRFNTDPAQRAIRENRAIGDYNASRMNTNTGANLAYRLQTAVGMDKSIADLYNQASNIQAQYDADYANTLNNLGQQYVGATNLARDINARNRATNRNIRRAGLSQLGEFAQNQQLMYNQRNRDSQMLDLYKPFLEQGYTMDDVTKFLKQSR